MNLQQKKSRQAFKEFCSNNVSLSADLETNLRKKQVSSNDLKEELRKIDPLN